MVNPGLGSIYQFVEYIHTSMLLIFSRFSSYCPSRKILGTSLIAIPMQWKEMERNDIESYTAHQKLPFLSLYYLALSLYFKISQLSKQSEHFLLSSDEPNSCLLQNSFHFGSLSRLYKTES